LGTDKENQVDAYKKGRRGKIGQKSLAIIRKMLRDGSTLRECAEKVGVSNSAISWRKKRDLL
jgi:hypothetical protein